MKTEPIELQVQAYLDGELDPAGERDLQRRLASDVALSGLLDELRATRTVLKANEPTTPVPHTHDFYWSKIQAGIERGERAEVPAPRPWTSLWLRWLAPAVCIAALAWVAHLANLGPMGSTLFESETEVGHADLTTFSYRSQAQGITVVWVGNIGVDAD